MIPDHNPIPEALGTWMNVQTKPLMSRNVVPSATQERKVPGTTFGSRNRSVQVVSNMSSHTDACNRTGFGNLQNTGRNILGNDDRDDIKSMTAASTISKANQIKRIKGHSGKCESKLFLMMEFHYFIYFSSDCFTLI